MRKETIKNFCERYEEIYVYGGAKQARDTASLLKSIGYDIAGYVVSEDKGTEAYDVHEVSEFFDRDCSKIGFVLGLSHVYYAEIEASLMKIWGREGFLQHIYSYYSFKEYKSILDVTTKIGCTLQCNYCPQKLLMTEYYRENKNRATYMSLEDFKLCLSHTPLDTDIYFAGMCEPFLNEECMDMIEYAYAEGYRITINTTLVGVTRDKAERLKKIKIQAFNFHAPDEQGMMNHRLGEEYFEVLGMLVPYFTDVMIFGTLKEEIVPYLEGTKIIEGKLMDRAGNVDTVEHISEICGGVRCVHTAHKFNQNVLLPDGSIALCCNDYGLTHILGNLKETDLQVIQSKENLADVFKRADGAGDIICRKCSYALDAERYDVWIARENK